MLYRVFKWLFYLTVRGYFRSIHIKDQLNIPEKGPVLFVANHTSAFMDPILLAVHINRPIYFIARGDSFKSKLVSTIFRWLHMIPIYKPDISPDDAYKNKMIFQHCFNHLSKGKTIMIFPEGVSKTERKLRPLKTGASRMALGAEQQNGFSLGVKIVPIGINYSNPHFFRSEVYVQFGSPIELYRYQSLYSTDPIKTVQILTTEIKVRLEQLIVVVKDESIGQLVKDIERLYRSTLRDELTQDHKASQDFYLSRQIVKAVTFYKRIRPKASFKFQQNIRQYFQALEQLHISDSELKNPKHNSRSLLRAAYLVVGFPVFLYGFTVNILPYKSVEFLSKKVRVREDFIGSVKLAFGMFVFLMLYIFQFLLITILTNWVWGILFTCTFYPSGLFAVHYANHWYHFKGHITYLKLRTKRKGLIQHLHNWRLELLSELDKGRKLFLSNSQ